MLKYNNEKKEIVLYHHLGPTGLGAILSRLMVGLNIAFMHNFDFACDLSGTYCIDKYYRPIFNKKVNNYTKIAEWNFFRDTWESQNKFIHMYPECPYEKWKHLTRQQWNMLLAQSICGNPTELLEKVKNEFKERVGWNNYSLHIGVHIRRGDKITQNPYIPMEIYYKYIREILLKHLDKKIGMYLTSDDDSSYILMKETFVEFKNVDILWDDKEKRYNNCNINFVVENPEYNEQETETGCKCISLLGDCDYVVGMSSAQFTWIGGLLSSYRNGLVEETHLMINPETHKLDNWGTAFLPAYVTNKK